MRQATVGPWFWVLTVGIGYVSFFLEHRLFPPAGHWVVKDWTPPTSRENCKGRKHLHARIPVAHSFKGTSVQHGFVFLCGALEGPGMGKIIMTKYILRLRAWRVLGSASAKRGQQTSQLRPFPDCCFGFLTTSHCIGHCVRLQLHTLQFTKADCRPGKKCPGSSLCWKCALWCPPKLMSFLWEQLQDWSWMNLRVCRVALAIKPVKTPHVVRNECFLASTKLVLSGTCASFHWPPDRGQIRFLIAPTDWCLCHWCWQANLVKPPFFL